MSLFVYVDGVNTSVSNIRLNAQGNQGIAGLPSAADGTGSQGGIVFDDPTGSLSITGWQIVHVKEPDTPGTPTLFYGTIADRTYRRGPYRLGASREIDTTVNDSNVFLSVRLVTGADANRPEETDVERLAWLIDSNSLSGMVYDLGFVNGDGRICDATNYRGMYPSEVLADIAAPRSQIFFAYWDDAAQKVGLFFDDPTATTYTCSLSISNVLSDVNLTTVFEPLLDGELVADPSDVYSEIRFVYSGGVVYRSDAVTAAAFFPPPIELRALQVENDKVGKQSTAIILADRLLAYYSQERFTVQFTVRLPSTKVGLIKPGMRIFLRFSHLPEFETGAYSRIEKIGIIPTDGDPTQYDVSLVCSTHGLTTGGGLGPGTGSGSTTPYPPGTPTTAAHFYSGTLVGTTDRWASAGSTIVGGDDELDPGPGGTYPDGTISSTDITPRTFVAGVTYNYAFEITAIETADAGLGQRNLGLWVNTGGTAHNYMLHVFSDTFPNPLSFTGSFTLDPLGGNVEHAYFFANTPGDGHVQRPFTVTWVVDPVGWNTGETPDPPAPGQPVENESVTMTGPTGTTAGTFAANSLRVFVDDVDHTDDIVSFDGTLKTFTLDFIPYSFEAVRVDYIAI